MSGWNIIYGLINFAILAAGVYFVGRKMLKNMLAARVERIENELKGSAEAAKKAVELKEGLANIADSDNEKCSALISEANEKVRIAGENSRKGNENASKGIMKAAVSDMDNFAYQLRRTLTSDAAAEIAAAASDYLKNNITPADEKRSREMFITELSSRLKASPSDLSRAGEEGSVKAVLTGAAEVGAELAGSVKALVAERFGCSSVSVECKTDASLIGGVKLNINDTVYDRTLGNMLARTVRELSEKELLGEDIVSQLSDELSAADNGIEVYQVGYVTRLSDGICRISGLSDAMAGEMLRFTGDLRGMVMDLDSDNVGVVLLGNYENVQEGDEVRRTGRIIEVPVGEALVNRVVDALGRPVDGKGIIRTDASRPIESPAPAVIDRQPVDTPMQTGLVAIDALVPIGRGQRELIIGDRQTGKTAIAIDTIINQKGKDVICIYVAIGQKESTVANVVETLRANGAMYYTIVVCANASEPAPMLYIAPYAGAAMGEYFMNKGKDVLIIYDDLSKHAVSYREISLLLHRPPGREAYPGDVFYLHSRLLERAAHLSAEKGGGSMTALPIIETQAGDISAYIPTNVISITDGQIFLESELFNSGVRPAINVGLSVSRVGGAAQPKGMKQFAGRLRMDLAQYRELAAFSQFGSDLDKATRATLARGDRMTELLKQPRYSPMDTAAQVISIFAANEGYMDDVAIADISGFESELVASVRKSDKALCDYINSGKKLGAEEIGQLKKAIENYKANN